MLSEEIKKQPVDIYGNTKKIKHYFLEFNKQLIILKEISYGKV